MLAGGDGVVSDVSVPVSWEHNVIREALYKLAGGSLIAFLMGKGDPVRGGRGCRSRLRQAPTDMLAREFRLFV